MVGACARRASQAPLLRCLNNALRLGKVVLQMLHCFVGALLSGAAVVDAAVSEAAFIGLHIAAPVPLRFRHKCGRGKRIERWHCSRHSGDKISVRAPLAHGLTKLLFEQSVLCLSEALCRKFGTVAPSRKQSSLCRSPQQIRIAPARGAARRGVRPRSALHCSARGLHPGAR